MKNERNVAPQILTNAMLFNLTCHCWSNRRKADNSKLQTSDGEGVTSRINATKRLIECPEFTLVQQYISETYQWAVNRSMAASTVSTRGVYFVKRDMIEAFEEKLEEASEHLKNVLVPRFLAKYDEARIRASLPVNVTNPKLGGLGDLYKESDYPSHAQLREAIGLEWSWMALSVPDELPIEIRNRENQKLRESYQKVQEEITQALRQGFAGMIEHAVDRLRVKAGEKPKIFVAESLVGNFREFFETFNAKNLLNDNQLEEVVARAKDIVEGFAPNVQKVKDSNRLRNLIADQFDTVKTTLNQLLTEQKSRRFNFAND